MVKAAILGVAVTHILVALSTVLELPAVLATVTNQQAQVEAQAEVSMKFCSLDVFADYIIVKTPRPVKLWKRLVVCSTVKVWSRKVPRNDPKLVMEMTVPQEATVVMNKATTR